MEKQKSKLELLVDAANSLNNEMHNALVEFLKEHNGFIRTDEVKGKDPIYAYIVNIGSAYETQECRILAVALFDNEVCILPDYTCDMVNLEGMTNEEILESDDWVSLMGGECIINATAYQLCECLEEYVEQ